MTVKLRKIRKVRTAAKPATDQEPKRPTAAERKTALIRFLDMLSRGFTKDEIVSALQLETNQFEALLARIYSETEDEHSSKTPLRIFAEYVIKKNTVLRDLEALKDELRGKNKDPKAKKKWYNAQGFVMACRLQSEIVDQQIKTGQDLGVIEKRPEGIILIDGRDPREMNESDLEETIKNELSEANKIYESNGDAGAKVLAFKTVAGKLDKS